MRDIFKQTLDDYVLGSDTAAIMVGLAESSEYWESALDFMEEHSDTKVGDLTARQFAWAQKIKADLEDHV